MATTFHIAGVNGSIEGNGEQTLVMIHGWPDTQALWQNQVAFFKNDYRCVTFTLPLFDEPQARPKVFSLEDIIDTIRQVIDYVSPDKPVILMVHDWGAIYGYQYVVRYPKKVSRLIGIDVGDAYSEEFNASLTVKDKLVIAGYQLPLVIGFRLNGSIGNKIARTVGKVLGAPAASQTIHANMGYPYYVAWTKAKGGFKNLQSINFTCHYLFIYGTQKPTMFHSEAWLVKIRQQPNNQVSGFKTSHWVTVDKPTLFNHTVLTWLQRLD